MKKELIVIFAFFVVFASFIPIISNLITPNWDFIVYYLNGLYFLGKSHYFDIQRPPVLPLILGFFGSVFKNIGIVFILFYILLSALFFISLLKFSDRYQVNFKIAIFVLLSSPIFLKYSLLIGTEILGFSFLLLSLYYLDKKPIASGLFMGLATLTRYTYLIFVPFLLLNKNIRKILISGLGFSVVWFPWLLYNWIYFNHPLYSFISSYALNVYFRENSINLLQLLNFLNPLLVGISSLYIFFFFYSLIKKQYDHNFIILNLLLVFSIISFISVPFKIERYMLPVIFILSLLIGNNIIVKKYYKTTMDKFIILFLSFILLFTIVQSNEVFSFYNQFYSDIKVFDSEFNISYSSDWVYHNLNGKVSYPLTSSCINKKFVMQHCAQAILVNKLYKEECKIPENIYEYEKDLSYIHKLVIFKNNCTEVKTPFIHDYIEEFEFRKGYNPFYEVCKSLFKFDFICKLS